MLAVDRGAPMAGAPIEAARVGIAGLVAQIDPEIRLGLIAFNGKVLVPAPPAPLHRPDYLLSVLTQFDARGASDLGAAIEGGVAEGRRSREPGELVLISVGRPTLGYTGAPQLGRIAARGAESGMRISTVAVGADADHGLLAVIARAGGGRAAAAPDAAGVTRELLALTGTGSGEQRPEPGSGDHDERGVDQ